MYWVCGLRNIFYLYFSLLSDTEPKLVYTLYSCLSVCIFTYSWGFLYIFLVSVCPSVSLSILLFICLSVRLYIFLFICLFFFFLRLSSHVLKLSLFLSIIFWEHPVYDPCHVLKLSLFLSIIFWDHHVYESMSRA